MQSAEDLIVQGPTDVTGVHLVIDVVALAGVADRLNERVWQPGCGVAGAQQRTTHRDTGQAVLVIRDDPEFA